MLAFVDDVAGLHDDVFAGRDEVFLFLGSLFVFDDELALAADGAFEGDHAVDARHLGGIFRTTGFEELGDAGQTTGDVLRLGRLTGRLGEEGAGGDGVAFVDRDLRADGNGISREGLVLRVAHFDLRIEIFFVLDDDRGNAARRFVEFALHGNAGDHVLEVQRATLFREDGHVVRIPLSEDVAFTDLLAVTDVEEGTDHDIVVFEFLSVVVDDLDGAGLVKNDVAAFSRLHEAEGFVFDLTGGADADFGGFETA